MIQLILWPIACASKPGQTIGMTLFQGLYELLTDLIEMRPKCMHDNQYRGTYFPVGQLRMHQCLLPAYVITCSLHYFQTRKFNSKYYKIWREQNCCRRYFLPIVIESHIFLSLSSLATSRTRGLRYRTSWEQDIEMCNSR